MSLMELAGKNRRTIRAPINPLDKCTIVSIFPKLIRERKPTIEPGLFIIQPGSVKKPSLLVVGSSSWWKEVDLDQPLLEIPNSSIQVANSVVRDYCNGLLACNMGDTMPGVFWVPGVHKLDSIQANHAHELATAIQKQEKYYKALVLLADGLWSRTNGHPLSISDDMRLAARELNLTDMKDWMKDFKVSSSMSQCPACGNLRKTEFPICASCNTIIDRNLYDKLGLAPVAKTIPAAPAHSVDDLKR